MPVQLPLDALRLRQLNIAAGGGGGGGVFMGGGGGGGGGGAVLHVRRDGGGATALFPKHPILSIVILNEVLHPGGVTANAEHSIDLIKVN